ncbi:MAG TPA: hypothetical protein PK104_11080 [Spirochaetota bacterium]|nr:hypothetical protein [Spirochaetota bacterium]
MLVEDEVLIAMAQERELKNAGYDVKLVFSGKEAIDFACNQSNGYVPNLVEIHSGYPRFML